MSHLSPGFDYRTGALRACLSSGVDYRTGVPRARLSLLSQRACFGAGNDSADYRPCVLGVAQRGHVSVMFLRVV